MQGGRWKCRGGIWGTKWLS